MIPHCYGFHKVGIDMMDDQILPLRLNYLYSFSLPDAYGFFMEVVQGATLYSFLAQIQTDKERLRALRFMFPLMTADLTRFRHTTRATKFAGVHQGDWHLDQVIYASTQ
jgi:hypothetical protein